MASTLLSQVGELLTVDIDCMDPEVAKRHTASTVTPFFCDMTSNQAIVGGEARRPEQAALLRLAIDQVKEKHNPDSDSFAQDVIDIFTVLLAKQVYPYLRGNVHAQTSPPAAFDIQKTVVHARKLVGLFEANGIPKSRVCIKIPTTAEGMVACAQLKTEGIQTLATCLFNVPQALAAHQAKCVYVAPYFNGIIAFFILILAHKVNAYYYFVTFQELRVHFEPTIWREYAAPGKEHPMSQVIFDVKAIYGKVGSKTKVMPASIVTPREVIGLVSLKPDHLTISGGILDKLAALPQVAPQDLDSGLKITEFAEEILSADYLASDGILLKEALEKDVESTRKLNDALKLFDEAEKKTKEYIHEIAMKEH